MKITIDFNADTITELANAGTQLVQIGKQLASYENVDPRILQLTASEKSAYQAINNLTLAGAKITLQKIAGEIGLKGASCVQRPVKKLEKVGLIERVRNEIKVKKIN